MPTNIQTHSFTMKYDGVVNVLNVPVKVASAFEPSTVDEKNPPNFVQFNGIWDTGATNSVITRDVIDGLKLKPTGRTQVHGVHGFQHSDTYLVNIMLRNNVCFPPMKVTEGQLPDSASILIGMDIIMNGDFALTHKDGQTLLSFRVPSVECIDFTKDAVSGYTSVDEPVGKVGRNNPCPCGSGKKYKKCCGK